jgi:FtsP/CotA-like multicopper oxidase with cupredoxin domain
MVKTRFWSVRALCGAAVLMLVLGSGVSAAKLSPQTPLDATTIPQFVENMPDFSTLGRVNGDAGYTVRSEEFQQRILPAAFYAALPAPFTKGTMVFGYGIDSAGRHYPAAQKGLYPGYTVVVHRYHLAVAAYKNDLVPAPNAPAPFTNAKGPSLENLLTQDQSIHWANPKNTPMMMMRDGKMIGTQAPYLGPLAAVSHLHGAEVPSAYDGGPTQWWVPGAEGTIAKPTAKGTRGADFVSSTYRFPNPQEPTTLWFHDHTLGNSRLNVIAGLEAFYLIRGDGDDGIAGPGKLPAGRQEVELLVQDREFDTHGQLLFPDGYPAGIDGPLQDANVHPFWMPEFLGDVIVVNGKSWPKLNVAPKRYRFRLLNGANVRFFNLQLCVEGAGATPNSPHSTCNADEHPIPFYAIGNDGGLLDAPVKIDHLLISPAERYDLVVDFAAFRGKQITVRNNAVTPYPSAFAKFTPQLQGRVMRFIVGKTAVTDTSFDPSSGKPLRGAGSTVAPGLAKIVRLPGTVGGTPLKAKIPDGSIVQTYRQLTLNPMFGSGGCHWPGAGEGDPVNELLLNNSKWDGLRDGTHTPIAGAIKVDGIWETEVPQIGSTEVWDLIDMSNDNHPIHMHLVQFQVIARIPYDLQGYGAAYYGAFPKGNNQCRPGYGPPRDYNVPNASGALGGNPDVTKFFVKNVQPYCQDDGKYDGTTGLARKEESGWKDTVIASCGHVTRVVVRFTPQDLPAAAHGKPINYAGKNEFPFDPTDADPKHIGKGGYPGGPGYVWHCHLIDHEDNEMMRPMIPGKGAVAKR